MIKGKNGLAAAAIEAKVGQDRLPGIGLTEEVIGRVVETLILG